MYKICPERVQAKHPEGNVENRNRIKSVSK